MIKNVVENGVYFYCVAEMGREIGYTKLSARLAKWAGDGNVMYRVESGRRVMYATIAALGSVALKDKEKDDKLKEMIDMLPYYDFKGEKEVKAMPKAEVKEMQLGELVALAKRNGVREVILKF